MGNYRFRLSDMIPNAWFYKLKDMSKTRKQTNSTKKIPSSSLSSSPQRSQLSHPGRYITRYEIQPTTRPDRFYKTHNRLFKSSSDNTHYFPDDPPRKSSSKRKTKRKAVYKPSSNPSNPLLSSSSSSSSSSVLLLPPHRNYHQAKKPDPTRSARPGPVPSPPDYFLSSGESEPDHGNVNPHEHIEESSESFVELASWSSPNCDSRLSSSSATDIIIDLNGEIPIKKTETKEEKKKQPDLVSEIKLTPISTRPMHFDEKVFEATKYRRRRTRTAARTKNRCSSPSEIKGGSENPKRSRNYSSGIRVRANSPRVVGSKKMQRKSVSPSRCVSESFAVVKSSVDPERDFMDSMMEMIVENNIRGSKDLEDLLASYLLLNSNEYHHLIVKAFEQIWFHIPRLHP